MNVINISNVRKAENDYACLSDIVSKMQTFIYEETNLNERDIKIFVEALATFETIQSRLFLDAQQMVRKFLRTA